jgi:hypothetical protein
MLQASLVLLLGLIKTPLWCIFRFLHFSSHIYFDRMTFVLKNVLDALSD